MPRIVLKKKWKPRPEVLLCPNVPKPLHGLAPRVILGQEWWDATRRAAYESTDQHCIACCVHRSRAREHQWLEGHELYKIYYVVGLMVYVETVPLCHFCHNFIHSGRLWILLKKGEITAEKFNAVIDHGQKVLQAAGLKKPKPYKGKVAEWGKWMLLLNGIAYSLLFKSYQEWNRHYQ